MTLIIPAEDSRSATHKETLHRPADIGERVWNLNLSERLKGLTWWWWWWIFFFDNPDDPAHPRQLMVLWSTKNCKGIKVMDFEWKKRMEIIREKDPVTGEKRLRFNGMTAVWYYDGKEMYDPFILKESDFRVQWKNSGELVPDTMDDLRFYGGPGNYSVRIQNLKKGMDFTFKLSPWSEFLSTPRYASRHYIGRYGYNILRFYGMRLKGTLTTPKSREEFNGSAYFQKVMVNAPSIPWYWAVLQSERGHYIDYFRPHLGFQMFRRTEKPRTWLDRNGISLSKGILFYNPETDTLHRFKNMTIRKSFIQGPKEELPVFHVQGSNTEGERIRVLLESYSRAYWRFEQRFWGIFRSILYYNEYPVILKEFEFS
ncbi:MAG: hypothetical protein KAU14_01245, partial [Thermoplasmata archaeon]|nr:hypothetical protein [Thermoplasmata archaeon]